MVLAANLSNGDVTGRRVHHHELAILHMHDFTHNEVKLRQQQKFSRLQGKDKTQKRGDSLASQIMSTWVKNCSDRLLTKPELSVLKCRHNFAVTPKVVPVVDVITAIEGANLYK